MWYFLCVVGGAIFGLVTMAIVCVSRQADDAMQRALEIEARNKLCDECRERLRARAK